jgi:hypothetical protein
MHFHSPSMPLLLCAILIFILRNGVETILAKIMDFWFPNSSRGREALKKFVTFYRWIGDVTAVLLVFGAFLGKKVYF